MGRRLKRYHKEEKRKVKYERKLEKIENKIEIKNHHSLRHDHDHHHHHHDDEMHETQVKYCSIFSSFLR